MTDDDELILEDMRRSLAIAKRSVVTLKRVNRDLRERLHGSGVPSAQAEVSATSRLARAKDKLLDRAEEIRVLNQTIVELRSQIGAMKRERDANEHTQRMSAVLVELADKWEQYSAQQGDAIETAIGRAYATKAREAAQ